MALRAGRCSDRSGVAKVAASALVGRTRAVPVSFAAHLHHRLAGRHAGSVSGNRGTACPVSTSELVRRWPADAGEWARRAVRVQRRVSTDASAIGYGTETQTADWTSAGSAATRDAVEAARLNCSQSRRERRGRRTTAAAVPRIAASPSSRRSDADEAVAEPQAQTSAIRTRKPTLTTSEPASKAAQAATMRQTGQKRDPQPLI